MQAVNQEHIARVVKIDGKEYAAGLWWLVREAGKSRKAGVVQARSRANKYPDAGYNCLALGRRQFGIASFRTGKIPRISALAASLRQSGKPMSGVFCLPPDVFKEISLGESWWVLAVSEGVISGDSDVFCSSREEAEQLAASLREMLGADCETVLCATADESLAWLKSRLNPPQRPPLRLEPLYPDPKARRKALLGMVLAALMLGGAFGLKAWLDHKDEQARLAAGLRLRADREARMQNLANDPGRHFTKDWLQAPVVSAVAEHCMPAILLLPSFQKGWAMEGASCRHAGKGVLAVNWGHRPGADYLGMPDQARLADSPLKAVSSVPLAVSHQPAPRPRDEYPLKKDLAARTLYQITQNIGARLSLNFEASKTVKVENVELTCPWFKGGFEMRDLPALSMRGKELFEQLQTIPALVLEEISLKDASWTIRGNVYVTP